jgi:hypothetical protein
MSFTKPAGGITLLCLKVRAFYKRKVVKLGLTTSIGGISKGLLPLGYNKFILTYKPRIGPRKA